MNWELYALTGFAALIAALFVWAIIMCVQEQRSWDVVTTSTTPDKEGWTCDDGITYWRTK